MHAVTLYVCTHLCMRCVCMHMHVYVECEKVVEKCMAKASSSSSSSTNIANVTHSIQPTSEVTSATPASSSETGMKLYPFVHMYVE